MSCLHACNAKCISKSPYQVDDEGQQKNKCQLQSQICLSFFDRRCHIVD